MVSELRTAIARAPNRKGWLRGLSQIESVKLKVVRAEHIFRGAPIAIGVSLVNVFVILALAWGRVNAVLLGGWVAAVLLLNITRAAYWCRLRFSDGFERKKYSWESASARNLSNFAWVHLFSIALNGALWGSLAPIFALYGMLDAGAFPFIIAAMTAAAVVSSGSNWHAVLAFVIPTLVPLALTYIVFDGQAGLTTAAMVGFYGFVAVYLARMTQTRIEQTTLLLARNERLLGALKGEVREAQHAEQRFRALVEAAQGLTLIFSPDGKVTYASPSVTSIFGLEPREVVGKTTKELVHPDDLALFRAAGERALSILGGHSGG